jgi:hypothetical protein
MIRYRIGGRMKKLLIGTVMAFVLAIPASAGASWGNGECMLTEHNPGHCYAYTYWQMEGGSESVKGAEFIPDTTAMNVPEWNLGAIVNNEGWLSFPSSGGGWLEIGQQAGGGNDCCTLHPFIAHAEYKVGNIAYGYQQYTWTTVNASPRNLYRIEDPAANGTWCEYIWNNQVDCKNKGAYWPPYSTELQAGVEVADNSHPTNAGSQEVDYIAHNGAHRSWGSAGNPANGYISPGPQSTHELCLTPNYASNHPGNANFGTGGC